MIPRIRMGKAIANLKWISKAAGLVCFVAFCVFLAMLIQGSANPKDRDLDRIIIKATENINPDNLRQIVSHLQSYGNRSTWEKQWETSRWLANRFKEIGLMVDIQVYEFRGKTWPNVVAQIQGRENAEGVIMPIAHLDSICYNPKGLAPGADDNGSGMAIVLEIARVLKELPLNHSIVFCVFSNEERGQAGSEAYVSSLNNPDRIKAVINLDSLGYSRPKNSFQVKAVGAYSSFRGKARAIYRMGRNLFYGYFYPRQALVVAGRPANGKLVNIVAGVLSKTADLGVRTLVGDDCG